MPNDNRTATMCTASHYLKKLTRNGTTPLRDFQRFVRMFVIVLNTALT